MLVSDTAGLRETDDVVEAAGISLARRTGAEAALRIFVLDVAELEVDIESMPSFELLKEFVGSSRGSSMTTDFDEGGCNNQTPPLLVINKIDTRPELLQQLQQRQQENSKMKSRGDCWQVPLGDPILAPLRAALCTESGSVDFTCHAVSCTDEHRTGLDMLVSAVSDRVGRLAGISGASKACGTGVQTSAEPPPITRARHREHLLHCLACLDSFIAIATPPENPASEARSEDGIYGIELAAEDLRQAALALGRVCGRVDVEDILDVIFRDFCIGK